MALQIWLPLNKDTNVIPGITGFSKESYITVTADTDGWYKVSDSYHTSTRWGIYKDFNVKPNTRYTLCVYSKSTTGVTAGVAINSYNTTASWPSTVDTNATSTEKLKTYSWTTGSNHTIARIYLNIACTSTQENNYVFFKDPAVYEDISNQGLANITASNYNASVNDNGKIGKCYSFGTSSSHITLSKEAMTSFTTEASVSFWLKILTWNTAYSTFFQAGLASYTWASYTFGFLRNNNSSTCCFTISNGSSSTTTTCLTPTLELNKWYHICLCYKTGYQFIYINGKLVTTKSTSIVPNFSGITAITLGKCSNKSSYQSNCLMNDLRIYDHCLSPKEIKEISKALVLHYKLDLCNFPTNNLNLVKDGWGGTSNWSPSTSSYVSTDVPSSPAGITNSYSNTTSIEYIPIEPSHSYTISEYVKKGTSSQSTLYISLIPYDVDFNRIMYVNTADGFKSSSLTTLSEDLKDGDSVIHLTSTTGWTSLSTYQYNVAIFGYSDSTGYTYPDLIYTRRVYSFGTTTDKSNIDTVNNQVTLLSPYTGATIPAGTSICITAGGATYYYPVYIAASNATDWTLISKTFTPKNVNYLKPAKYVRVVPSLYSGQWAAGVTLIDNTLGNTIYDLSGYQNNGTVAAETLLEDNNTPRYNYCIKNVSDYPLNAVFDFPESNGLTFSCWINLTAWGYQTSGIWSTSSNSTNLPQDYYATTCNHYDGGFAMRGKNGTTYRITCNITNIPLNTWKHVVLTHDGTDAKLYINGTLTRTVSVPTPLVGFKSLFLGWSNAGGANRKCQGSWSDFRMYATALSAEDVLELYNTATSIDNKGNIFSYGFNENELINLFTLENWNLNARTAVQWTTRNGERAVQLNANNFYYGSGDNRNRCFNGLFLPNSQYMFDMWIDYDDIVSGNANRQGGIEVVYTDNTVSYTLCDVGDHNNPIGWKHKIFYSDPSKSIKCLYIYYYTSTGAFYRWDSVIMPVSYNIGINKNGILNGSTFNENSDIVQFYKSAVVNNSQLIEK